MLVLCLLAAPLHAAPPVSAPAAPSVEVPAHTDAVAPPSVAISSDGATRAEVLSVGRGAQVVSTGGVEGAWSVPAGADRLAVRDDGWVAFVAPWNGWAAVWVSPPGGPAVALTNRDVVRRKGLPPEGFTALPVREGDLRFVDGGIEWMAPDGLHVLAVSP